MNNDTDKLIKKIERDLKENSASPDDDMPPIPRGAPTLRSHPSDPDVNSMDVQIRIHPFGTFHFHVESLENICFGAACEDCDWQIPSAPTRLENPHHLFQACLHAHENAHNVTCTYSYGEASQSFEIPCRPRNWWEKLEFWCYRHRQIVSCFGGVCVGWSLFSLFVLKSEGWQFWVNWGVIGAWGLYFGIALWDKLPHYQDRFKRWAFCIGLPLGLYTAIFAMIGQLTVWGFGSAFIGCLIGTKLYTLYKKRKEKTDA